MPPADDRSTAVKLLPALRRLTRYYPFLRGTRRISRAVGPAFSGRDEWLSTPDRRGLPRLALNVGTEFQRRLYLFPAAYGRLYLDSEFIGVLRRELSPGGVFLDIGTNVGVYSMLAAEIVGHAGKVYSFEPDPVAFAALGRSAVLNGFTQVVCANVALADVPSEGLLYRNAPGSTANSLVGHKPQHLDESQDVIHVRVTTLDEYCRDAALPASRIQLIKIDVEGAEARTVTGMLRTLREAGHPPIWCEVRGPRGSARAPGTYEAVASLLAGLDYAAFRVVRGAEMPASNVVEREDILFRHRKSEETRD